MKIELMVCDVSYGSREIKCESSLDQLSQLLISCSNPIEVMCQVKLK